MHDFRNKVRAKSEAFMGDPFYHNYQQHVHVGRDIAGQFAATDCDETSPTFRSMVSNTWETFRRIIVQHNLDSYVEGFDDFYTLMPFKDFLGQEAGVVSQEAEES